MGGFGPPPPAMASVQLSDLWNQLLPDTQQRLAQDWRAVRESGTGESGAFNRYGFTKGQSKGKLEYQASKRTPFFEDSLEKGAKGAAAGYALGGGYGAFAGAMVGVADAAGQAWAGKRTHTSGPGGKTGYYGSRWLDELRTTGEHIAADPEKMALAMMFTSPEKRQDPFIFSRTWRTKKKGFNRRKKLNMWSSLGVGMHPGSDAQEYIDENTGFLDWKGYGRQEDGWGTERYSATMLENLISRYIYGVDRDLWQKENQRGATRRWTSLNLKDRDEDFTHGTEGYVSV